MRQEEIGLGFSEVNFESFERGIKRFGYCNDITDECLMAVMQETSIDPSKF